MAFPSTSRAKGISAAAVVAVAALTLASCSAGGSTDKSTSGGGSITIGTTDKVTTLDPAGSYDNGSFSVQNQVFPFLMNTPYGSPDVEPDIATKAEFTSPTEYTVTLKPDLKWANGNDLTSSDVKFTFDRQLAIADDNGPSSLLYNLASVAAPDDTTVVFTLKQADDQIFPQILSSPAGPIVDEDSFSATALTSDNDIVKANAFAGQYVITSYDFNNLVGYKANKDYAGLLGPAKTDVVNVKYYADASNLKLDVQQGNIDVAFRSLSATDIEDLRGNDKVKVVDGPGGELRYVVFNFDTQPFGAKTPEADPAKALAVRQAVADLVDREEIAKQVYKGTYTPVYSYVPAGLTGATESLKGLYGDGKGAPDRDKAKATLAAAGVTGPVVLNLQYSNDHYGPSSGDEYALVKDQLEASGLFTVNLQTTEWVQYAKDRTTDVYPVYQLGWFPDYSDADNYLTPFFLEGGFLKNHYSDPEVDALILKQAVTAVPAERTKLIEDIQDKVAAQLSTVPLLQGAQVAVTGTDVTGTSDTLDASFKFRYAALKKG
ncbi:peptide ABC transporter substrate-binding protein [Cryobacterium sp. TMT2-10]|uniref:ABC transporter substrate-binding protein n=1 Tax=unclassified Cryobacterium TaxID=2649013 RepID=UPI0010693F03|nr:MULTISPECIES: ABC transporter substrate-binding protein [unclassified Cryobacterium]TFC86863.1 peptide ABC transporter substrate-binding protein [Cryobacterium sp. TmT2-59]TFD13962.1 peptide ABC transporter substrate-binding protein [Cryobacterium sp. TMT4-10]TFD20537.1 peptide ABC transporter substrate-binding protein [Cryobacterium sp. TMT2-23]TFD42821.1 peptide ABC transporter substrate-binding protein [Cryobacterium sp. TMT2-10]